MATPEEIAAAKEGLTGDQLKWLGNADPTDPFIRARGGLPPLPGQTTVPSASDVLKSFKLDNATIAGAMGNIKSAAQRALGALTGRSTNVPKGAMPQQPAAAAVNVMSVRNENLPKDTRVKIRVPRDYIVSLTQGPGGEIANNGGIVFPYTPSISVEHSADYAGQNPLHSNYTIYFYQRSKVGPIKISGKFTVQNDQDAAVYLATVHLLRSLTKMRYGTDPDRGSPPPVCRLDGFGAFMFENVPVVLSSFTLELPDSVDYYTIGKGGSKSVSTYDKTAVPVLSTISVTLNPVYSRNEMLKTSVTDWLGNPNTRKSGYL